MIQRLPHMGIDVLLLDADLIQGESRPAIRQLKAAAPQLKILPIGLETDQEILECL
ncbi:MAG: hypothetical protein GWN87_26125, partial [Desulfuromonadales bacterium]|nr:hypothetical protein [Desulfuromonadales bacterium]